MKRAKNKPSSRLGWAEYYMKLFHHKRTAEVEHLALWYYMLHLAFDLDEEPAPCDSPT